RQPCCAVTSRRRLMARTSPQDQSKIEASIQIGRPVREVFGFYRDFRNLPRFLGDVMAIEQTGPKTTRWTIQGPLGIRAHWTVEVTDERPDAVIRYETVGSPGLRARWEITFAPGTSPGTTEVREVMTSPLGMFGLAALAVIGKFPAREVSANLRRLKQLL